MESASYRWVGIFSRVVVIIALVRPPCTLRMLRPHCRPCMLGHPSLPRPLCSAHYAAAKVHSASSALPLTQSPPAHYSNPAQLQGGLAVAQIIASSSNFHRMIPSLNKR